MMNRRSAGLFPKIFRRFSDVVKKSEASVVPRIGNQFSKYRLKDFGELPRGEIPRELEYVPRSHLEKLSNGAKIYCEEYPTGTTVTSLYLRAGSRFETQDSLGVAHVLWNLSLKGNLALGPTLERLGANVQLSIDRDIIGYHVECLPENAAAALTVLCQAVLTPNLGESLLQAEKHQVFQNILNVSRDQHKQSLEFLYFTCFRDHSMGQSAFGAKDNIKNINLRHVEEHIACTYAGENALAVFSGDLSAVQQLQDVAARFLGGLPAAPLQQMPNLDRPLHTPSTFIARDDEMHNINIAVGYCGPPMSDPKTFHYRMFQEILGQYDARHHGAAHLNYAGLSYNYLQRHLGRLPGVGMQTCAHLPSADHSLFTAFIHGNEAYGHYLTAVVPCVLSQAASNLNIVEVYRARARWFNKLLLRTAGSTVNDEIARELFFIGRRIDRSEAARRYSALACEKLLAKFAYETFFDAEVGMSFWGACHNMVETSYYSRIITDATKGRPFSIVA